MKLNERFASECASLACAEKAAAWLPHSKEALNVLSPYKDHLSTYLRGNM